VIQNVGLNPSRSALLDFLVGAGASLKVLRIEGVNGELIGDLEVRHAPVRGGVIEKDMAAALIDEILCWRFGRGVGRRPYRPRRAGASRQRDGPHRHSGGNFKRMGLEIEVTPDGMRIRETEIRAAAFDSFAITESLWRSASQPCGATDLLRSITRMPRRSHFRSSGIFSGRLLPKWRMPGTDE